MTNPGHLWAIEEQERRTLEMVAQTWADEAG
jgi:hypothetical protein